MTTDKTIKSKYQPKQTNVTWVDLSGKTPVEKHFINGKWVEVGGGGGTTEIFDKYINATDQQRNTALANVSNQTANSTTGKMGYKVLDPTKIFAEQVTAENTIYEIRDVFDLNAAEMTIPSNCTLKFNGGKIENGTLIGSDTKLDGDIKFGDNITIGGSYEKKDVMKTSVFDGEYDDVDLVMNIDLLANNLELVDGEVLNVDKKGYTIHYNSIFSKGYATINFNFITEQQPGFVVVNDSGFALKNLNISEDYTTTSSSQITTGSAFGIQVSASNKTYDLIIENCNFSGTYNSSCIAVSNIRSCLLKNCKWSNVVTNDHYVYCSTNIKNYIIEHCVVENGSSFGMFKVRNTASLTFTCENLNVSGYSGYGFVFQDLTQASIDFRDIKYDVSNINPDKCLFTNLAVDNESATIDINIKSSDIKLHDNSSHVLFNPGDDKGNLSITVDDSIIVGSICKYGNVVINNSKISKGANTVVRNKTITINNTKVYFIGNSSFNGFFNLWQTPKLLISIKNSEFYTIYDNRMPIGFITGSSTNGVKLIIENTYIEKCARSLVYQYTGDISLFLKDNNITLGYGAIFNDSPNANWLNPPYGLDTERPTISNKDINNEVGVCYFDKTLGKPIWWNGTAWVDSTGTAV